MTTDRAADKSAGWKGHAEILNVATGARTPLPGLSTLLSRDHLSDHGTPYAFSLSPDRSWLVWINDTMGTDSTPLQQLASAHFDGSAYRSWKQNEYADEFFPDSSHWVERPAKNPDKLFVRDLQDGTKDRLYQVTEPAAQQILDRHRQEQPFYVDVCQKGDLPQGMFGVEVYRGDDKALALRSDYYDRGKEPPHLQLYSVKLPRGASEVDGAAADTGGNIYYDLLITDASPTLAWLRRWLPALVGKRTVEEGLWVSRRDGRGLREIGHLPAYVEGNENVGTFTSTEWLPGGKQISFEYKNTLYLVDAEPSR